MGSWADFVVASALYAVGFCFLGLLFFLCHLGDHSLDASRLAEDGLGDSNSVAADLGTDSLDDSEACYLLAGSIALPRTELACHSL
jgi:hypothetical protein